MTLDEIVAAQTPPDSIEQMAQRQAYQSQQVPNPNFGGLGGRMNQLSVGFQNGLGRLKDTMFPVDQSSGVSPEQAQALKTQALIRMGLGMMAAGSRPGARLGDSLNAGYQAASTDLTGALQNAYQNTLQSKHLANQDKQLEASLKNQEIDNQRAQQQFEYKQAQDAKELKQRELEQQAIKDYRDRELKLREQELSATGANKPPAGFRWNKSGGLEFIPGGPADPDVANQAKTGKLSEQEEKTVSFVTRMQGAEKQLQDMNYAPHGVKGAGAQIAASIPLVGNSMKPEDYQRYEQSASEWISGLLRSDSGAAIAKDEFTKYFRTYFPQLGDSDSVVKQKQASRERAMEGMTRGLSPSALRRLNPTRAEGGSAPQAGGTIIRWESLQ
jgi:hypothetical protein